MSTISSFDEALDFFPEAKSEATKGGKLLPTLHALWEAMTESYAAAYRYRELVARGATADSAASQVFAEFYAAR